MAIIYKTFRATRTVFYALFGCFLLFISPAYAVDDLFKIDGVKVDVTADSALAARDQAFDKAQVDAFTLLAGRMLSESEVATFKAPDVATVSAMVQDYEVTAEKLSSVRYIGTYNFTFRQKAVERFFNVQGSAYTNVVSAPLVVLPFYQKEGRTYLWSPYNVWMQAWNRAGGQGAPVPLILPIGDLEDVKDIGDEDVFSYNPEKLASLLKRYDAGDAAITVVAPDGKLANAQDGDFADGGAITISLYRTDRGQPEHVQDTVIEAQANETYAKLLDRGVEQVQSLLRQNWKEKTVVAAPVMPQMPLGNSLVARVKIRSLEEWSSMQKSLNRVNAITNTALKSLTPREALVELSYRGDEQLLRQALAQQGMQLSHPQYAGYSESATDSRLIYDLSLGAPVPQQFQPSTWQSPAAPQRQPLGGGYQSPRQQLQNQIENTTKPPGGYPLPPREDSGYSGRF